MLSLAERIKLWSSLDDSNSTIFYHDGREFRTTQDPYITDDGESYKAEAISSFGDEVTVYWEVIDNETTDESEACDWDNPVTVEHHQP